MAVIVKTGDEFAKAVDDILQNYTAGARTVLDESIKETSKEAVKKVKKASPVRTGEYKKSWKAQQNTSRLRSGATVYAKAPKYRLTHLLEKGHAKRGGGRVKAIPHIAPVNEWAQNDAVERFKRKMENYI